jgi:nucleoid-associated protein YgaU
VDRSRAPEQPVAPKAAPLAEDKLRASTDAASPTVRELTTAGWVPIANTGKVPVDDGEKLETNGAGLDLASAAAVAAAPRQAHVEKGQGFQVELERYQGELGARTRRSRTPAEPGGGLSASDASSDAPRVDTVYHTIEPKENFWTISGLYYGSHRYYRALWKANAKEYPQIDGLHVNDVIKIPPPEDLDTAYIDPPRKPNRPGVQDGAHAARNDERADPPEAAAANTVQTARASARSSQRASYADESTTAPAARRRVGDLDLPLARTSTVSRRGLDDDHVGRRDDPTTTGQEEERPTRASSRQRVARYAPADRHPVYKVRPYDTLRSIARDTLGDARRSDEIEELNRAVIDDPSHLTPGQIIELPEDARTPIRRRIARGQE